MFLNRRTKFTRFDSHDGLHTLADHMRPAGCSLSTRVIASVIPAIKWPQMKWKKWIDNTVEVCQQMNISIHEAERLAYDRHKMEVHGPRPGLSSRINFFAIAKILKISDS